MKPLGINYGTQAQIAEYTGVEGFPAQPVWATDEFRLYMFTANKKGGYAVAMKADLDSYPTKTFVSDNYLGLHATADKAKADANGAEIHVTYATKDENSKRILGEGARGALAGYETSGTAAAITATAIDSNEVGANITVADGAPGTAWTKIVRVTAEITVELGPNWNWENGDAPTIVVGGILTFCWCGSGGIAKFASPS